MVNLKDYLGSLVLGINQARAMADLESVNIAKLYAQDALLKNFSVPRFRVQDIVLTVPVAIDQLEEQAKIDYQPIDNKTFNSATYQTLKDVSKVSSFSRSKSTAMRKTIAAQTDLFEKRIKAGEDVTKNLALFSGKIASQFLALSKGAKMKKGISEEIIVKALNERMVSFISKREEQTSIKNASVIVEAHKLKEIDPKSLIQIKMTLTEEGMEWQTMENEKGEIISKLLPE